MLMKFAQRYDSRNQGKFKETPNSYKKNTI